MRREPFRIEGARGAIIRGDALLPERARDTVIICHGFKGFARWGFFPHLAARIAGHRMRAITFDFSGSGIGDDRERFTELDAFARNTYTQELGDLECVIAEADQRGWLSERYGLFGHSRGGGVAILHAARSPRVAALVTWAAIATVHRWSEYDLAQWRRRGYQEIVNTRTGQVLRLGTAMLDELESKPAALDIERAASQLKAPWLIVHGTADESVPADDARALAAAADRSRSRLLLVDGAGHTFNIGHPMGEPSRELTQVIDATVSFFLEHLA